MCIGFELTCVDAYALKGAALMKTSKFAWWFAQIFGFIGGVSLIRGLMHGGVINYVACIVFFILWGVNT